MKLDQDLGGKKKEVEDLQKELSSLVATYKSKLAELTAVDDRAAVSKNSILSQLKDKENVLEENSDALGQSFMDGKTNVQAFVPQYHELRKKLYSLRAKIRAAL